MLEEIGRLLPFVATIDVGNGHPGQLFLGDVFQAAQVDAIHLADRRVVPDSKGADAAALAEVVVIVSRVEHVLRQIRFARE